mmetsp:Transcript_2761/g.4169  ORF Transcript_2761/g.4169 Transcript_2761/m.4169 type:complete len:310 (+) Transcript_2761:87-1016(+)
MSLANRMANLAIRSRSQISRTSVSATGNCIGSTQNLQLRSISHVHEIVESDNLSRLKSQLRIQGQTQPLSNRQLSTAARTSITADKSKFINADNSVIAVGPDGTKYSIPPKPLGNFNQPRHAPKIKPRIVKARVEKLRIVEAAHKSIRHSPWRLNLICQFAANETDTVPDALQQLEYVRKVKAPLVSGLIHTAANTAKQKYGLLPSQLEVSECFATHGTHLKRIKTMGRGRSGKMHRRFSHIRLVLREIDFPLKIMQSKSVNQRNKWVKRMETALDEAETYRKNREEIEKLEKEVEEMQRKKAAEEKES